jgi:predicted PurR-regulated permease PerM
MGSMSPIHWLFVFVEVAILWGIIGYPVSRIMHRTGYSRWWSVVAIVPIANLIALWIFAFVRWPMVANQSQPLLQSN